MLDSHQMMMSGGIMITALSSALRTGADQAIFGEASIKN